MSATAAESILFEKGDVIIEENSVGKNAYIILRGEVEIYKTDKRQRRVLVGRLGPNEMIGEICLFEGNAKRSASVVAFTDSVELIELSKSDFDTELAQMSPRMQKLVGALIQRLKQTYTQIAFLS